MQKVEDFRKEVELRRRLERNQERLVVNQIFADGFLNTWIHLFVSLSWIFRLKKSLKLNNQKLNLKAVPKPILKNASNYDQNQALSVAPMSSKYFLI